MTILAMLSDDNTVTMEPQQLGLRIISSTYDWLNPPEGKAFYMDGRCLQGGPILVQEFDADASSNPVGEGQLVNSGRSIIRHRTV